MKILFSLLVTFLFINASFAQKSNLLVAKTKNQTVYYTYDEAVRIGYNSNDSTIYFRGKLMELNENTIVISGFGKQKDTLEIKTSDLVEIKRLNRTGKIVTGVIASLGFIGGISLISQDNRNRDDLFDGLVAALGTGIIISSSIPFILVAATPGNHTTEKGFQFYVAKRK